MYLAKKTYVQIEIELKIKKNSHKFSFLPYQNGI